LCGERLVEDDRPFGAFDDHDETMDIMIHPD